MSGFDSTCILNLSDFTFKKKLGEGTIGKVQLYLHNDTNQEYAIKLFYKDYIEQNGIKIDKEMNIMKDLNHINLLKVYKKIYGDDEYGIVLEYCEDGDLQSLIKKKNKLSEKESLVVLYQILNGIKYLHEKNYLHRDLKSANIMIINGILKPLMKITDFDLSRNLNGASIMSTRAGTPLYTSPEILEGERYDGGADVWSIGCIFYEMLTGSVPYYAASEDQLLNKIKEGKLNIPEGLSDLSIKLLLKSLDIDVRSRATVNEMYNMVLEYVGKEIEDKKHKEKKVEVKDEGEEYLISKEYDNEIMLEYYKMKLKVKENVNNEEMLLKLGMLYEEKKDYVSMKKYYFQLNELSNEEAKLRLGRYYLEVEKDFFMAKICNFYLDPDHLIKLGNKQRDLKNYEMMKICYEKAIELKNSHAMYNLANYYYYIAKDYEKAKKYYEMAIELNHSGAMNGLANYYHFFTKNYEMAKKYYLMGIELKNSHAMNSLGHYYKNIEQDYEMAKKYYLMSIELSNSTAMNNLGYYYYEIEKDYETAKKYYLMGIEFKNSHAMNNLGNYYKDIEKNYEMAKKYYEMAINLGNSNAMNGLGNYYHMIVKDYEMAKKYYLMAIELKNPGAMNNLALYYYDIEKDYAMTIKYYLMGIELNHSGAMNGLANYYKNIEQDYEMMKNYYLMAIKLKNSDAMNNLAVYYDDIVKDYEMAKKYYLMAIELENTDAMNNLANYYKDIEKDDEMAKKYYEMANKSSYDDNDNFSKLINYFFSI